METTETPSKPRGLEGFTLIEMVIATGILSVVMFAIASSMVSSNSMVAQLDTRTTIDQLFMNLRDTIMNEDAIKNSIQATNGGAQLVNRALANCMTFGWSGAQCYDGYAQPFTLYSQNPGNMAKMSGPKGVSGPNWNPAADQPMMYGLNGVPCTLGQTGCLVQVTTGFKGFCPEETMTPQPPNNWYMGGGNGTNCTQAEFIEFDLTVASLPDPRTGLPAFSTLNWVGYYNHFDATENFNP